ncbi:MAG: CpsD/CapB family tyrosine-protein kinase [Lachnospiraceae bacterium]|nr:CpsD/CapB family tyrosine-protein kinase [Lachnospiraceae bacterium]
MSTGMANNEKRQISLYSNTSQVMNDAIDRIVVEIHNKKKKNWEAHKILLTGCAPQCGNTSICIGLGISFATSKWRTLIVDCDLRKKQDIKKLNENTGKGLSDFLESEQSEENFDFNEIIYPTNVDNLSYIPCGKFAASPARLFCSNVMQNLLAYVNENFDYVIFDFPSVAVVPDAQILFGEVDGIVLVSALESVTKKQIREAKRKVAPYAESYYGMIINKIEMGLYRKYVQRFDYYFFDKNGNQKLAGKSAKKYKKHRRNEKKEETENEQNR